jgi:hypothetical protein
MAAKRKQATPRKIREAHASGAAESAASAGARYCATVAGIPAKHAILDRSTGKVMLRPNLDHIEVHHEVEQLNNGTPVNRRSRGRLSGANRTIKDSGIKLGEVTMPSPTELVGRMVYPHHTVPTYAKLKALQESGGKLKRAEVPDQQMEKFLEAVYRQLSRKFDI